MPHQARTRKSLTIKVTKAERSACQPAAPARHVYRRLTHELPDRSAGPVAAGQRFAAGNLTRDRKQLFLNAGKRIVELIKTGYYEQNAFESAPSA